MVGTIDTQTFGRRLYAARVAAGLPDDFVARELLMPYDEYREIEKGLRQPTLFHLGRLADLLDRSIDFLVAGRRAA